MKQPKHTPGPWTVYETPRSFVIETVNVHRSELATVDKQSATDASLNARLIASAPCLLEALEAVLMAGVFHETSDDKRASEAIRLANAALAKARGES